jgi:hypothetical protein
MKEQTIVPARIGILYEHPEWFLPLFSELDRRGIAWDPIRAEAHSFDPDERSAPYDLVVNRVSPSAYLRDNTPAIFYTQQYLAHLEALGVPVVNGTSAFELETSKARQLSLLARLGLPHPRSRVVNAVDRIVPAARELEPPIIVKPNIGGSGALMRRFEHIDEVEQAVAAGGLDGVAGLDHTAIVQEFHPALDGGIVRVEALAGEYLYAIHIASDPNLGFNLCPADICQAPGADGAGGTDVPTDRQQRSIEAVTPPRWVVEGVLAVFAAAGIHIGGVEYVQSARDGQIYLYDINALSNFVTDAPRIVGFDPFARLVDYLAQRVTASVFQLAD